MIQSSYILPAFRFSLYQDVNFLVLALFQSRSFSQHHRVIAFISLGYVFSHISMRKQNITFLITHWNSRPEFHWLWLAWLKACGYLWPKHCGQRMRLSSKKMESKACVINGGKLVSCKPHSFIINKERGK